MAIRHRNGLISLQTRLQYEEFVHFLNSLGTTKTTILPLLAATWSFCLWALFESIMESYGIFWVNCPPLWGLLLVSIVTAYVGARFICRLQERKAFLGMSLLRCRERERFRWFCGLADGQYDGEASERLKECWIPL